MDTKSEYLVFLGSVKERVRKAQYAALKAVNTELVGLYWDIGRMISEKQNQLGWGKAVVETISVDLRKEFPKQKGFSISNLWLIVKYYNEYQSDAFLQALSGEISFSHNVAIFTKCKNPLERKFYTSSAKKFGWSFRVLQHQIDNKTYEK